MRKILVGLCLALMLIAAIPSQSSAQGRSVRSLAAFEVPPDQAGAFLEMAAKTRAVFQRHAPDSKFSIYAPIVGGNPGTMVGIVEYPSAEAWGAARPKIFGDPEFQASGQAVNDLGARLVNSVLQANVTPSGGSSAMFGPGSVALVLRLNVPPGQQAAVLERVLRGRAVVQRHAPESRITVWADMVAGAATANTNIVVEYPSAEAWGAAAPKINMDREFQQIGQELTALGVEVVSNLLVRNVTP